MHRSSDANIRHIRTNYRKTKIALRPSTRTCNTSSRYFFVALADDSPLHQVPGMPQDTVVCSTSIYESREVSSYAAGSTRPLYSRTKRATKRSSPRQVSARSIRSEDDVVPARSCHQRGAWTANYTAALRLPNPLTWSTIRLEDVLWLDTLGGAAVVQHSPPGAQGMVWVGIGSGRRVDATAGTACSDTYYAPACLR